MYKRITITFILLLITAWSPLYGATLIVNQTGPDDGTTAGTLRKAVNDAAPGDTIKFDFGGGIHTITLSDALTVDKDLTFITAAGDSVQISGGNSNGVLIIEAGTDVDISDVTITNGRAESGGGIFNSGDLLLVNVSVINNSAVGDNGGANGGGGGGGGGAGLGGGIFNDGTLTIENSAISQNDADGGNGGTGGANTESAGSGGGDNGGSGGDEDDPPGTGGFGSGGGGGGSFQGGNGGFGGGGGGGGLNEGALSGGTGSAGGGNGGTGDDGGTGGGGGGGGLGGGIFNDDTGVITIRNTTITSNTATGGNGGTAGLGGSNGDGGEGHGGGIYNRTGGTVNIHTNDLAGDVSGNTAATSGADTFGTVTAIPVVPNITATGDFQFGPILVGNSEENVITISNTGDAVLNISSTTISGSSATVFSTPNVSLAIDPGASYDLPVTFIPNATGFHSADLDIGHDAPNESNPFSNSLSGFASGDAVLLNFPDIFIMPGEQATVSIDLDSPVSIAFMDMEIEPTSGGVQNSFLSFNDVTSSLESQGFDIFGSVSNGVLDITLFDESQVGSPANGLPTIDIVYDVDVEIPPGTVIDLDVIEVGVVDDSFFPHPVEITPGRIYIGNPGDLDSDGDVNILDIIAAVRYAIGALPEPTGFQLYLSDLNEDGNVNVLDVIALVNVILNIPQEKAIPDGNPAVVQLSDPERMSDGQFHIPLHISTGQLVAGFQATLTADGVRFGSPFIVGGPEGVTIESHEDDGRFSLMVYSAEGRNVISGNAATLMIPVRLLEQTAGEVTVGLHDVILADRYVQLMPVTIASGTSKLSDVPDEFALANAYPNPFNPATHIAYEVPQQAHITLTVYNILGQEVSRLVDEVKQPGRYSVTWQGRNAFGNAVASGVYLYRLTSSTGFSDMQRMMLLK